MPIIGKHHVHPYSKRLGFQRRLRGDSQGEDEATVLLINIYRMPASGVFRPQRFWFRGLWRKPGQRFAVCGRNPAWQILQQEHDEDDGAVWLQEGMLRDRHKVTRNLYRRPRRVR